MSTTFTQLVPPVGLRRLGGHRPRCSVIPHGNAMSTWPGHQVALNQSQLRATAPPMPNDGRGSTSSRRRGASSTRSWRFFTKSWGWTPSLVTDDLHKISLCKRSPVKVMASGASAVWLPSSCGPARLQHRHGGQHVTTTDAPMRVRTLTPTPTLTPRRSSGGHHKTLPRRPFCCAAVRRRRPPRSDECASN
jgi:hypothetical protein